MGEFYATPRPLHPRERLGIHCVGGWVGPRASSGRVRQFRHHRDSIPRPSSPWQVAVPIELSRPILRKVYKYFITGGVSQCCRNDSYCPLPSISPYNLIASAFCICVLWLSEWLLVYYNIPVGHISKRVDRFDIF